MAPGLVDSPPISIISAPSFIISAAYFILLSKSLNFPPSEKLSGVTLSIPIIFGLSNLIEAIFFLGIVISFICLDTSLNSFFSNDLISFNFINFLLIFFLFLLIISIVLKNKFEDPSFL